MLKELLLMGLRILGVLFLFLLLLVLYISGVFTNYKAYKDYCSGYISLINDYFEAYGAYPSSLNILEKPPGEKLVGEYMCSYQAESDRFYLHIPKRGSDRRNLYSSINDRWSH